ncbi:MAG: stage II sporulation protein R [Thermaerobacter sp.]|nr:stage II sporulation protein R [Thermaerobacter sp.]
MSRRLYAALCGLVLSQMIPMAASAAPPPAQEVPLTGSPVVVRLHIVANSNSPNDIAAKVAVRNALWNYLDSRLASPRTADAEVEVIEALTPSLSRIAKETLQGYGLSYPATVRFGSAVLPERTYLGEKLPAGRYATILVVLGKGKGQNWWCLLFPQLCFSDQGAAVGYDEHRALIPTGFEALPTNPRPVQTPIVRPGGLIWSFWRRFHLQQAR